MKNAAIPALGIIEGFYGRSYNPKERNFLIERIASFGYSFYIYGPKNDEILRKKWRSPLDAQTTRLYKDLKECCMDAGMQASFALSPLKFTDLTDDEAASLVLDKISDMLALFTPSFICLLFDDIPVEHDDLGVRQNTLLKNLLRALPPDLKLFVCPSFYSFDPVLEKIFGTMPENYFSDLRRDIPPSRLKLFWTGNQVISTSIKAEDIKKARAYTGSEIMLWDNYPVNDGKKICDKLFTAPFFGRDTLKTLGKDFMHAVNPMCEAALSSIPLSSLPLIYKGAGQAEIEKAYDDELKLHFGQNALRLKDFLKCCGEEGLEAASVYKDEILKDLSSVNTLGAAELRSYLNGEFAFDPACLT